MPNSKPPVPAEGQRPTFRWAAFKAARKEKGLRQRQVAQEMGVHLMSVSGWERGIHGVDPYHWGKLHELIGLPLEEISRQCALFSPRNNSNL